MKLNLIHYIMNSFGNRDGEKRPVDQAIETIKSDYEALQKEIILRDEEIAKLKEQIATYQTQEVHTPAPEEVEIPAPETKPTGAEQPVAVDCTAQLEALKAVIAELKAQNEKIMTLVERRDIQDENIRAMHKEVERYKVDFFAKITQPYLVALMDLHRRFYETYAHFDSRDNSEVDINELYKSLMHEFYVAIKAVSDRTYNDFGVEYFEPALGEPFNPKMHQAMATEETSEAEKHLTIAKIFYGGFQNIDTGKILRQARVVCFKYVEPKAEERPTEVDVDTAEETPAEVKPGEAVETAEAKPAEL